MKDYSVTAAVYLRRDLLPHSEEGGQSLFDLAVDAVGGVVAVFVRYSGG